MRGPAERAPAKITKPALNLTADYFIPPTPNTSDPDFEAKAAVSKAYSAAGVDTGSIAIRGGTHYEFSWIPDPAFPAALRGADLTTWYTTAWFDAYVKGDPTASRRLRTDRWRDDAADGRRRPGQGREHDVALLPLADGHRRGGAFLCEDLRKGCPGLLADDGEPRDYDYLSIVTRPDAAPPSSACVAAATGARRLRARQAAAAWRIAAPDGVSYDVLRVTARTPHARQAPRAATACTPCASARASAVKHVVVVRRTRPLRQAAHVPLAVELRRDPLRLARAARRSAGGCASTTGSTCPRG